jgi:hypothetical protein
LVAFGHGGVLVTGHGFRNRMGRKRGAWWA